ncbi:restriction endonuclease [Chitinimonas sp. PSY-7]|uniref:restriction endonuclease n=1 Tax=Chitinimonas sp. PSY-7 TaxID=3459088 RepID=UPI0040400D9D
MDQYVQESKGVLGGSLRLSWKVSVLLAVLSYLVLHSMAGLSVPVPEGARYLPSLITAQFISGLATWLQCLLPSFFIAVALFSFWRARQHDEDEVNPTLQALQGIGWEEFEVLIAAAFQKLGYTVRSRSGCSPQGGVDVVLTKRCEVFLVQGSQWQAKHVGAQPVRELHAVMAAARASGGFVLSAGQFSPEAQQFAREHAIELIEGPALLRLIQGLDLTTLMPAK